MKNSLPLRERFAYSGARSLSDVELLALLISTDNDPSNQLELAYGFMKEFGSLRALFAANQRSFCQIHGSRPAHYAQLHAAKELLSRYEQSSFVKQQQITHINQTYTFLKQQLRDEKHEVFSAIFLDNQHRIIAYERLFHGSINVTTVHIRPIIERIIYHNAAAIILAHNHPSGVSDASEEDFAITKQIKQVIAHLDTRLLDHIIIGDNEAFSIMHEQKWLC